MNVRYKTIVDLHALLKNKQLSSHELQKTTLKYLHDYNPFLNSTIEIIEDSRKDHVNADHMLANIPFVHKDVILLKGYLATAASKILSNHISPYSATVLQRVLDKGGYTVGRANCDEFAMGSTGETSYYGPTKNPWNLEKVPGGSSSGSAAVVAAGLVPYSFGSETGGSVRQPAVLCGISGLKTTYGLHSRFGLIAYASSLDQIGIFAHTAEDIAVVLSTTAGNDCYDHTSISQFSTYDYYKGLKKSVKGVRIGIIENALFAEGVKEPTRKNLLDAISVFEKMGCVISYVKLSTMEYSAALYFIISRAEAASNLSRFDGVRYGYRASDYTDLSSMYQNTRAQGFGYTVKRRIMLGNYVLAAEYADEYYNKAKEIQNCMKSEFISVLKNVDCLFCPVVSEPAFKLGEMMQNPLAVDLQDYFTAAANLVGVPALALPSGLIDEMPMGFQLIGNYFSEELLLQLGYHYQRETIWHKLCPKTKEINDETL